MSQDQVPNDPWTLLVALLVTTGPVVVPWSALKWPGDPETKSSLFLELVDGVGVRFRVVKATEKEKSE